MFEYTEKEAEVAAKAYAKFNAPEPLVTASLLALVDIESVQEKWVKKNLPVEMPVEIVDKVLGNLPLDHPLDGAGHSGTKF